MTAPLIAAAVLFNREEPRPDSIELGMETFADRQEMVSARWDLARAYNGDDFHLDPKRQLYLDRMADTALLVCTSGDQGSERGQGELEIGGVVVGPGLAARGISEVLWHERMRRLQAVDYLYGEATHTRQGDYGTYARGPVVMLAKRLEADKSARYVSSATFRNVKSRVAEGVLESMEGDEKPGIRQVARMVMDLVTKEQMQEEREVLAEAIKTRENQSWVTRWWSHGRP